MGWGLWGHLQLCAGTFLHPPLVVTSPFPCKGGFKLTLVYNSLKKMVIEGFWWALMP